MLRLNRFLRRDAGSTIVPVIGMVAVAGILTALIASVSIHALSFTSMTRAGVQAQAAADAGLEFMRAQLVTGTCPTGNTIVRTYGDVYSGPAGAAEMERLGIDEAQTYFEVKVESPHLVLPDEWSLGCPVLGILLDSRVRITSTGYASAPGLGAATAGDAHTVEAIHKWTLGTEPPGIAPSGPAVYAHSSSGFNSGGDLHGVDGSQPNVYVRTGSVDCSGGSSGIENLVVAAGDVTIRGGCNIAGSVWAHGSATLSGGVNVGGNIVASSITQGSGGTVGGSVWATGNVAVSGGGEITGTATAGSLSLTNGDLRGGGWIQGASNFAWGGEFFSDITTRTATTPNNWSGAKAGAKIITVPSGPGPSPYPTPGTPTVPDWVDYSYSHSDWEGFSYAPSLVTCSATSTWLTPVSQLQQIVNSFGGTPGVIDARICLNGIYFGGDDTLNISNDLVIIANKFNLTDGAIIAPEGVRLWLITPDTVNNGAPNCPVLSSFSVSGGFDFPIDSPTMVYTPCKVTLASGTQLRGQLYVGAATITAGADLWYDPIGLPGHNLDTGSSGGGGPILPISGLGELESYRDVTG